MDEMRRAVAIHEAGHAVLIIAFDREDVTQTHIDPDSGEGVVYAQGDFGPDWVCGRVRKSTSMEDVISSWAEMIDLFAGMAAQQRDELGREPELADLNHPSGRFDRQAARRIARKIWPNDRQEALRTAAKTAIFLTGQRLIRLAILDVAEYLYSRPDQAIPGHALLPIVRKYLPGSLPIPYLAWAIEKAAPVCGGKE